MAKLIVSDLDLKGKKVLIRVDFNVPIKNGVAGDDNHIIAALPTTKHIIEHGGKATLLSHLSRVKSDVNKKELSLRPAAERLNESLKKPITLVPENKGEEAGETIDKMKDGDVIILENIRFQDTDSGSGKREPESDPGLGGYWISFGDVFVSDVFGTAHKSHASNVGIVTAMKKAGKPAATGSLLEKEIRFLSDAAENPVYPFVTIPDGARVSDKIGVTENLIPKSDHILIGGGMAYMFLAAQGHKIGKSSFKAGEVELAEELLAKVGDRIALPISNVAVTELSSNAPHEVVGDDIPDNEMGPDIGPKAVKESRDILKDAKTVVWNEPMGAFETPNYAEGTLEADHALADLKNAIIITDGGDSTAAAGQLGIAPKINYISIDDSVSPNYLEGKKLPGIVCVSGK